MKTFNDLRNRYEKDSGHKVIGWVEDYTLWLEDKLLFLINKPAEVKIKNPKKEPKPRKVKTFIPPTEQDVIEYFKLNGYPDSLAKKVFQYYNVADWVDAQGSKIINWKQKMISNWFKEEHKFNKPTNGEPPRKNAYKRV